MLWSDLVCILYFFPGSGTYYVPKRYIDNKESEGATQKPLQLKMAFVPLCPTFLLSHFFFLSLFSFLFFFFSSGDKCTAPGQLWQFFSWTLLGQTGTTGCKTKAQEHLCSFDCSRKTKKAQHVQWAKWYGQQPQQFSKIALVGHSTGTLREQALARACLHSPGRAFSDFALGNVQSYDCGLGVIGSVWFAACCFL